MVTDKKGLITNTPEATVPDTGTVEPVSDTATGISAWISQPSPVSICDQPVCNGVFYGSLVLIALSIGLLILFLRHRAKPGRTPRKKAPRPASPKEAAESAEQSVREETLSEAVSCSDTPQESKISEAQPPRETGEPRLPNPRVLAAFHQHIGARRDQQDSFGISDVNTYASSGVLAVVADGMGGLANGAAVSNAITSIFLEGIRHAHPSAASADILLDLTLRANRMVNQMLIGSQRSGSTLVAAMIRNGSLYFLTVGDSRIYLFRGGALIQLNREHIYQEELALRAINQTCSLAEVHTDRQAHALTSYIGMGTLADMDRNYTGIRLVPGDKLLLASDGVFGTLSQMQLEDILTLSPEHAVQKLGSTILAAAKPGQDNNTAIILEYQE